MNRLLFLLVPLLACAPTAEVDETDDSAIVDDTGDTDDATGQTTAVITTTDYAVGSLATLDFDSGSLVDEIATTSGDPMVFADQTWVYQVNGYLSDSVRVYAPGTFDVPVSEFSVGAGGNPHDVALVGDRLFVSCYDLGHLRLFNPQTGSDLGTVDLTSGVGTDGIPEASTLELVDGELYVALQDLDRDNGWVAEGGRVAHIDTTDDEMDQTWSVGPSPEIYPHPYQPGSLVVLTGTYDGTTYAPNLDGGLAVLDTTADEIATATIVESTAGYHLTHYVENATGQAMFLTDNGDYTYSARCYDWNTDTLATAAVLTTGDWLSGLSIDDRGIAWVVSRSYSGPSSIRRFDVAACSEADGGTGIQTTLPPYQVAFF